jgi:O-antigen/teichoic acid export membrane protein
MGPPSLITLLKERSPASAGSLLGFSSVQYNSDRMVTVEISGRGLLRSGILNITGQALSIAIGLATVPLILHGLGPERFGLLVFSWTLTGTFNILDLGLTGAVTKFVAEALGRGDAHQISSILWPAVAEQTLLGFTGAGLLIFLAPWLVTHFLHISPAVHAEAILAFRISGLMLPTMLLVNSFRGALEAAQRFDIAVWVKGVSSASTMLVPLGGVVAGWDLPRIMAMLLLVRVGLVVALYIVCGRLLGLAAHPHVRLDLVPGLFRFGGWYGVSSSVGIGIGYADRFAIGNALSMVAVANYAVPFEVISRLGLIAGALAAVLFPAFSTLGGTGHLARPRLLFGRSIKYVVLTTGPAFGLLALFAPDVIRLWLGPVAAGEMAPVFRILSAGAVFQVLAVIPATLVQGIGRPDLHAKFSLIHLPLYLIALLWLVRVAGSEARPSPGRAVWAWRLCSCSGWPAASACGRGETPGEWRGALSSLSSRCGRCWRSLTRYRPDWRKRP